MLFKGAPSRQGPYKHFAGRDASRALALMSLAPEDYGNPSLEGLKDEDLQVLEDWFNKFKAKYPVSTLNTRPLSRRAPRASRVFTRHVFALNLRV